MGSANSTNKFGPSNFVIGPVLGAGVNYTSFVAAISDANAIGGANIIVRPGNYTEDFSMAPFVFLQGALADNGDQDVFITGQVNVDISGACGMSKISMQAIGKDTVIGTAAGNASVFLNQCHFSADTGFSSLNMQGANSDVQAVGCIFDGNGTQPNVIFDGGINSLFSQCTFNAQGGSIFLNNSVNPNPVLVNNCQAYSSVTFQASNSAILLVHYSIIESLNNTSFIADAGCSVSSFYNVVTCNSVSTFWATGTGTFLTNGANTFLGTSTSLDPGLTTPFIISG